MISADDIRKKFIELYGDTGRPVSVFFAPGRVNLIGEHIDYSGGKVFPVALSIGITAAVRLRDDKFIRMRSTGYHNEVKINLEEDIRYQNEYDWGNYPAGVIRELRLKGKTVFGCDILFASDLPDGSGLSSSAALEVLTGFLFLYYTEQEHIDKVALAKLCKDVENDFIGVNCGIMDQFAVAMGKKNNATLLDTATLEYRYVPFDLTRHQLLIMNTKKRRELADSKYNERRAECERALSVIQSHTDVKSLVDVQMEDINRYINDPILRKRAKHVTTENWRVVKTIEFLEMGNLEAFGRLMVASHASLRENYEVTGKELDVIVEEALKVMGCIGARMTGAGFGGCAIAIVESDRVEELKKSVSDNYKIRIGHRPEIYSVTIEDGVRAITFIPDHNSSEERPKRH